MVKEGSDDRSAVGGLSRVALLGLGEAGRAIAADLVAAGVQVVGWDPVVTEAEGVAVAADAAQAASGAQIVLSVNSARAAKPVAEALARSLQPGQLFADLNSASPALKREIAEIVKSAGAAFVDVALMAPVPGRGIRTPSLISGDGARRYLELLGPAGLEAELAGEEPGAAAARKLLRSVFVKGMHAAFLEGYAAAEKLGWTEWYVQEAGGTLEEMTAAATDRILRGTRLHAARRTQEMEAAAELVRELGIEPVVTSATISVLAGIASEAKGSDR